jgi:hypothetical protein
VNEDKTIIQTLSFGYRVDAIDGLNGRFIGLFPSSASAMGYIMRPGETIDPPSKLPAAFGAIMFIFVFEGASV